MYSTGQFRIGKKMHGPEWKILSPLFYLHFLMKKWLSNKVRLQLDGMSRYGVQKSHRTELCVNFKRRTSTLQDFFKKISLSIVFMLELATVQG
jgi:hypothetical protein